MNSARTRATSMRGLVTVVMCQCALVVALVAIARWAAPPGRPWWLLTVVLALVVGVVPMGRHRPGLAVQGGRRLALAVRSATSEPLALPAPCQFRHYELGFCWQAPALTTVLQVELPPTVSTLDVGGGTSTTSLDLAALARELRRYDIALDSMNLTVRSDGPIAHPIAATYWQMVGPLAAVPRRHAWLTLAMTSQSCPDAIARRGGGTDGLVAALHTATRRVQNSLSDQGFTCRALTAADIREAARRAIPAEPRVLQYRGNQITWPGGQVTLLHVSPDYPQVPGTTTSYLLGSDGRVDAVLRVEGSAPVELPHRDDTVAVAGHAREALARTVPGLAGRRLGQSTPPERHSAQVSGCGLIIGANSRGQALAVPIATAGWVRIAADLSDVQALVLRAVATGSRVVVRTDRPAAWVPLAHSLGPEMCTLQPVSAAGYHVVVYDGAPPPASGPECAHSLEVLEPQPLPPEQPGALWVDTTADGRHLRLHSRAGGTVVDVWPVMIAAERRIIGAGSAHQPPGPRGAPEPARSPGPGPGRTPHATMPHAR